MDTELARKQAMCCEKHFDDMQSRANEMAKNKALEIIEQELHGKDTSRLRHEVCELIGERRAYCSAQKHMESVRCST